MRIEYPKPFVHSRLKSYIDGNLKLEDIKHPSKITFHEPHIRNIARCYPAPDHDTIPNSKLNSWILRTESRVRAYIHGEMTINELVHPSKITQLSQQAIKQKIQKSKILNPRPAHPRRRRQKHWIELGRQLDRIASSEYDSFHSPPFVPRPRPHTPQRTIDELPKAKQSALVFNGNVNILYVNMARKLDQNRAKPICQNSHDIDTISRKAIHPDLDCPQSICQQLIPMCRDTDLVKRCTSGNTDDLATTVGMLTSTIRNLSSQYQHVMSDCSELAMERDILLEHKSVSDRTIDILAHQMRELKRKNESSELTILELSNETRALEYQNQESESTIHNLAEEVAELKRKNETLSKLSKKTMQQLKKEMRDLKHHNQYLADQLNEKIVAEETVHLLIQKLRQLKKQNRILTTELQQQITDKNQLSSSVARFKSNLNLKIENIERCFNSVLESIQKTKEAMQNHSPDTGDTNVLLDTIHNLDEQNAHLMGKIKLFPEMLKRTLAHVSCSMNALEEQNGRLLRVLQNTEIEHLSAVKLRKRVRTLTIE